ncbi:Para-aminobenzoate synthase, aminase component [Bathymodiolus heckerae thiotrophic gill symbiont]|uniref:aminodeoxychorismate synthase component I n=1 Tax=Bathymodiolus heckerae thiotrophic gill symbiont TaxID=1052212 RepID=UPI0010B8CA6E|nr:aminodeoxychorismate synthase component I [Bathymodiolus heckerae thiotrophic gill symbiont]SHN90989.1 Para-aminobenzoate synthase, aminase component [Bathymodiolus heckerae thiotrophic gill symbiont]
MNVLEIPDVVLDGLCQLNKHRYPFLLESVNHNDNNRYSILFAHPQQEIALNKLSEFDFLTELSDNVLPNNKSHQHLPFTGGWFVYLAYELIGQIEPTLAKHTHDSNLPIAIAVKTPSAIIIDHQLNKTYLIDEENNQLRIDKILEDIKKIKPTVLTDFSGKLSCEADDKFLSGVGKIKNYIKAGDVFQVNLSRAWNYTLKQDCSATQLYSSLKKSNPAPFSALAQFEKFSIISSSPERLFSVDGNIIETRPIAGTHPRGQGENDEALKQRLINHPKEQAEHIMLLDLERNDLGRVCEYGSIEINEVMTLETYPYVHHIVSNIKGKLKHSTNIDQLVRALFPGGTITGCPKIRCMEIISELEGEAREAYTGSLGYISNNGKVDFNILIRTMVKQGQNLSFRAGAGIVFDSEPRRELEETLHKAQGILKVF